MKSKRREFIDRLLRISELNEDLLQPAYTKRIKLLQMGKAEFNMPINSPCEFTPKYNCKILVIDKPTVRYNSEKHYNIKDSNLFQNATEQTSPGKQEISEAKLFFSNRKINQTQENQNQNQHLNFVSPIVCEFNSEHFKNSTIVNPKRPQSQYKPNRVISSSVKSISKHRQDMKTLLSPHSNMQGILSGKSIKFHKSSAISSEQDRKEEERKSRLLKMKEINKNYANPFIPPPKISAKSYIVAEVAEGKIKPVVCYNSKNSQQVASLTKIMTCIVILDLCGRYNFSLDAEQIKIGKYECSIGGTTAELKQGQIYTVRQLLYGLMLPSGNDASLALAVWGGKKLLQLSPQKEAQSPYISSSTVESSPKKKLKSTCYLRFIKEMNQKAQFLEMNKTRYANSHGLSNPINRSTSYDIALLCQYAMKNHTFREIVSCRYYQSTIKFQKTESKQKIDKDREEENYQKYFNPEMEENQENNTSFDMPSSPTKRQTSLYSSSRSIPVISIQEESVRWENTHKLLHSRPHQYIGIKTGVTETAGPCLSSMISINSRQFLIIVLGCSKVSHRFKETQILKRWLLKHLGLNKRLKKANSLKFDKATEEGESQSDGGDPAND